MLSTRLIIFFSKGVVTWKAIISCRVISVFLFPEVHTSISTIEIHVSMGSMIRSAVWLHDENFPCIDKLE
jgi:hypothetical protein